MTNEPLEEQWNAQMMDDAAFAMFNRTYKDRIKLGGVYVEKRKYADDNAKLPDGRPNPLHPRFLMEAENAKLQYDMAYMMEMLTNFKQQLSMYECLFQRVGILEGAYNHLMAMAGQTTLKYITALKNRVLPESNNQPKEKKDE